MSRGPDVAALLERALVAMAARAGLSAEVREADWTRWASATFSGTRHRLTLVLPVGAAATAWLDGLAEAEFALRGHLVADAAVVQMRCGAEVEATIEILTVEER